LHRRTGRSLEKTRDGNPEDLMRPWSAEPIGASGHAATASTGRTHDRKQLDHAKRQPFSCKPGAIHTWLFSSTDSTAACAGGST
jgi:hypothetical protein